MTTLRCCGGSLMLAIPNAVVESLRLTANSRVRLSISNGRLIIDPARRRRYTLAEPISDCDEAAAGTVEDRAWLDAAPVGTEEI